MDLYSRMSIKLTLLTLTVLSYVCMGDNSLDDKNCRRQMERVYRNHVIAPIPPDIKGDWLSTRCEVRSGPEFILRRYRFQENGTFEARQYFYADSHCHNPIFSIVARGTYKIIGRSWIISGAMEADYTLNRVSVMSYTDIVAKELSIRVNETCPGSVKFTWKPFEAHDIFHYMEYSSDGRWDRQDDDAGHVIIDLDCTAAFDFALHELQLMRMEVKRHHSLRMEKTLFLGDVHTDRALRREFRPTSFQEPLTHYDKMPHDHSYKMKVMSSLMSSDDYYPARLPEHHFPHSDSIFGEWYSERCEMRPFGHFLTRHLIMSDYDYSWEAYYHHYTDEMCTKGSFTIYVRGRYFAGPVSETIDGAYNYVMKAIQLKITPRNQQTVLLLNDQSNADTCGKRGTWVINEEQEVTSSGGCPSLSVSVPHIENDLFKVEHDHHRLLLYLGKRPLKDHREPIKYRPTSFQLPLVKCSDVTVLNMPVRNEELSQTLAISIGGTGRCVLSVPLLLLILILCSLFK